MSAGADGGQDGLPSEIIDRLYDVALDPNRYERLLDSWEARIGPGRELAADAGRSLRDPQLEAHVARADVFLDRFSASTGARERLVEEFANAASFVIERDLTIGAVNGLAATQLGARERARLSELPIGEEAAEHLEDRLSRSFEGREPATLLMRFRSTETDRPILLHVRLFGEREFALVVSSELGWPESLDKTLVDAFGLSRAETEVVRGLVESRSVKEIAADRDRSVDTVRTQMKAIFQKTETKGQAELVRICLSLMDIVSVTENRSEGTVRSSVGTGKLVPRRFRTLELPDGRLFDYLLLGAREGKPLLYLPLDYGLVRWPASAEAEAEARGIRVVVPVRPGYGQSTPVQCKPHERGAIYAADMMRLLDHLGIDRCPILALGSDSWYAHHIAAHMPERFTAIVLAGGTLPMDRPAQYERMGKWHRFINANAKYAPHILPFLVKGGFSLARRIGKRGFIRAVYGSCPADVATFEDPEIYEAMMSGSEIALSEVHSAHDAFAQEVLAQALDWSPAVHACQSIPTFMYSGDQDPHAPPVTIDEWEETWRHIVFERFTESGDLIFFQRWRMFLDRIAPFLGPTAT